MLDSPSPQTRSPWKWLTFGVASLFLLTLIGLVIYADFLNQNRPPVLTVEVMGPFRAVEEQFYVPFTVANEGGESAEAIQIVAELRFPGETDDETGEQQIASLSGGEQVQGSFVFSHDPSQGELVLRVASYREPQVKGQGGPGRRSFPLGQEGGARLGVGQSVVNQSVVNQPTLEPPTLELPAGEPPNAPRDTEEV